MANLKKLKSLNIAGYYKGWNETEAAAATRCKISLKTFKDILAFNTKYNLQTKKYKFHKMNLDGNQVSYITITKSIKRPTGISDKHKYIEGLRKLTREIYEMPEDVKLLNYYAYASWGNSKNILVKATYKEKVDSKIMDKYSKLEEERKEIIDRAKAEKKKTNAEAAKEKKAKAAMEAQIAKEKQEALNKKLAIAAAKKKEADRVQKIIDKIGLDKLEELLEKTA